MSQSTLGSTPYQNSNLFSGYYLDERIYDLDGWDCDEDARVAFEDLKTLWELEGGLVDSYKEDELLDEWIDEVLDVLGFGTKSEATLPDSGGYNDRLLFTSDGERRDAAQRVADGEDDADYKLASAVLEAKQWDADFSARFSEARSYRDASHQIKYYLEHTPENLKWGILTDGKKWRLYGTKDYATEIYYEVDLPELLATGTLEQFKYFYAFFRPDAFRETAGTSFLDTVWNESETAAQELGEDLQDNVFTALRVLGEGFVHSNDLDIDPDDEDARAELKEQSLVLLYRLMFVLYAESRGLIHPDDADDEAEYREHFSLDELRADIHEDIQDGDTYEDYSGYSTQMWSRLQDLFGLIDAGEESLDIPAYNGGLFDDEEHEFLAENEVADRYIAEVIHRLGTTLDDDGKYVLADYADLDTRHLGSIYEGLLEHEFRIAGEQYAAVSADGGQVWQPATEVSVADAIETVEEGELYVVNDDGERKATGAYYTPDYVVSYIVEETIDPLLDDIKAELEADGLEPSEPEYFRRFWQSVLDLKVLDPAMGSAHFLTSATGYLTEQVMEVVREQEIQGYDEQHLRRDIAKECIYGVDINGMAVELGKLSMWLETLAADQPLAFLDHHLKDGNSLVGSDITDVLSDDVDDDGGQLTLMQAAARARKNTLEHVMELMQELLAMDNESLDDIKSMEDLYDEIRDDPLYGRLFEIANVHTAEEFGLDVPEGVYEEMAGAIEDEDEWAEIRGEDWFESAQEMADEEDFFHWELEYPEVFFGEDGEKRDDAGFDAVIGNPPYVEISGNIEQYLRTQYDVTEYFVDLFHGFIERAIDLNRPNGQFSYILPEPWLTIENREKLRHHVLENTNLRKILRIEQGVFQDATVDSIIVVATKGRGNDDIDILELGGTGYQETQHTVSLNQERILESDTCRIEVEQTAETKEIFDKIQSVSVPLQDVAELAIGVQAYNSSKHSKEQIENRVFHSDIKKSEEYLPEIAGNDVSRYNISFDGNSWIKYGDHLHDKREFRYLSEPRILVRQIPGSGRYKIHATYTEKTYCNYNTILNVLQDGEYDLKYILALVNSSLMSWVFPKLANSVVSNNFPKLSVVDLERLPIRKIDFQKRSVATHSNIEGQLKNGNIDATRDTHESLSKLADKRMELESQLGNLNLSLKDHFGNYSEGSTLATVGFTQPPKDLADSILQQTTKEKPNLRVGEATVERESPNTVEIRLTARYKPDEEDKYETDQWGYTETEPLPALRITDLTESEADLAEVFIPVAVDEANGFANFRETATKTNSLVDRLRKLTLPRVDDIREGLESYTETKERAEDLKEKIERTDDLIDKTVYNLYELTDEEIEIVEETFAD
ncbi:MULTISPECIES: Eco57I restriction-modification methylase domain-containing protein [Halobacterium]|uniref:Eco57I restriction-modification methylase domain-containing protein n=1 Tax=Halobacterium TaxID=2239 RepID=UPI00073E9192|nr:MULTISPECIES: TaqI-like C-terminal specificity domain-containing protein [Halobacterium]MCG1002041.1 N-6 DNA methylase [Halobacterium noricense]